VIGPRAYWALDPLPSKAVGGSVHRLDD
jgi:hypothetical protein